MINSLLPTIRVWLGGSFDPVHCGHVTLLEQSYQALYATFPNHQIVASFLPTAGSPLKASPTSAHDRIAMLQLAIQDFPHLSIDTSEIGRKPPIYTFDTLSEFQARYPDDVRIFIMGADSALSLSQWYRGFELIELANLWIVPRPNVLSADHPVNNHGDHFQTRLVNELAPALQKYVTFDLKDLINQAINHIYIDNNAPPRLASREVREWLQARDTFNDSNKRLMAALPNGVMGYIVKQGLYQI